MESSMRVGLMAVFAVSGSMVLLVHQVHKRLLSNFMKKFECEIGGSEKHHQGKKKVRFAKHVSEIPKGSYKSVTGAQRVKAEEVISENGQKGKPAGTKLEDVMPPNRAILYRGIMKYRKKWFIS